MHIAIIEIAPKGHYTYVESMVKIYASDKQNRIVIFTNTFGLKQLKYLENDQISLVVKGENEDYFTFFQAIKIFDKILNLLNFIVK